MATNDAVLTRADILQAAEEVLRRFGPAKATVVDVARALGVSHGCVYRHFPSKAALRDAVTAVWLDGMFHPLDVFLFGEGTAYSRLHSWLDGLVAQKHAKARDEPELFATYLALAAESTAMVRAHVAHMEQAVAAMISDGVKAREFRDVDPKQAARAVLHATARFHNPVHLHEWTSPTIDVEYKFVAMLVMDGLLRL